MTLTFIGIVTGLIVLEIVNWDGYDKYIHIS